MRVSGTRAALISRTRRLAYTVASGRGGACRPLGPAGAGAGRSWTSTARLLFAGDEPLQAVTGHVVRPLLGRRFHEVGRRGQQASLEPPVQGELAATDGVDHDAGRVRRVPDLELQLHVDRLL